MTVACSIAAYLLCHHHEWMGMDQPLEELDPTGHTIIGAMLGFMLVFRTQQSYNFFLEGHVLINDLTSLLRSLAVDVLGSVPSRGLLPVRAQPALRSPAFRASLWLALAPARGKLPVPEPECRVPEPGPEPVPAPMARAGGGAVAREAPARAAVCDRRSGSWCLLWCGTPSSSTLWWSSTCAHAHPRWIGRPVHGAGWSLMTPGGMHHGAMS